MGMKELRSDKHKRSNTANKNQQQKKGCIRGPFNEGGEGEGSQGGGAEKKGFEGFEG